MNDPVIPARRLHHVGVLTKDIDAAVDAYVRRFGADRPEVSSVDAPGIRLRTTMLRVGSEPSASIQLIEPALGPGVAELDRGGEGTLFELAWEVADIEAAADLAVGASAALRDLAGQAVDAPVVARSGSRYFYLDGDLSGGTRTEIIQPAQQGARKQVVHDSSPVGEFDGRVALVTGGASGIGAAIVELLVERGARVAILDLQAELGADLARRLGGDAHCRAVSTDVTDPATVRGAVDATLAAFGPIDIAVNSAGLNRFMAPEEVTEDTWRRILAINLDGTWNVCAAVMPGMMQKRSGRIVNIGSAAGVLGIPKAVPYSTAKHAIVGLTRSLAVDLGPYGITVNCVAPGTTLTPLVEAATSETFKRSAADRTPLGRLGTPRDLAEAVLFLASERAAWITGVVLPVDGGMTSVIRAHHWE